MKNNNIEAVKKKIAENKGKYRPKKSDEGSFMRMAQSIIDHRIKSK